MSGSLLSFIRGSQRPDVCVVGKWGQRTSRGDIEARDIWAEGAGHRMDGG